MRKRSLLFLSLLVPAFLVLGGDAVKAQQQGSTNGKRWSDPATWPNRKVPVAGDKVTIDDGKEVVLDVNSPPLNGLTINGKLSFANNKDVELTTEWIMLHGELEIGTEQGPSHPQGHHHLHRQRQRRRHQWSGWNDGPRGPRDPAHGRNPQSSR